MTYLIHANGPAFADEPHVVDLRFETAVEKSIAVGREAADGFATADDRAAFAKKLGEYRRRGAFDPALERILNPLEEVLDCAGFATQIDEVRIFAAPFVSRARIVRIIIVCFPNADIETIDGTLADWYTKVMETTVGISFLPLRVARSDDITLEGIRGSIPVYFRSLSEDQPQP